MGELEVILNGVQFRTRHNDYSLKQKSSTSPNYNAVEEIEFPDIPKAVSKLCYEAKYTHIYIYIYIYIYIILLTACVYQLANSSDTQAVGCGFKPRPDHKHWSDNII